jgi:hypothetical protein
MEDVNSIENASIHLATIECFSECIGFLLRAEQESPYKAVVAGICNLIYLINKNLPDHILSQHSGNGFFLLVIFQSKNTEI